MQGRSGTILEGESGFNDPVGIALMIGMVEYATHDDASLWTVVDEFVVEMLVGLAVGLIGALALVALVRKAPLPDRTLYPIAVILTVAASSTARRPLRTGRVPRCLHRGHPRRRRPVRGAHGRPALQLRLSDLGELAAFVALGLTIDLGLIGDEGLWWHGLVLAALLGFVIRPLVVGPLLAAVSLSWGERGFIVWSGLKGAVPILLASLAVVGGTDYATEIYGTVFVVVLFSVVVQGSLVPAVAGRLGVEMVETRPTVRSQS